MTSRIVILMPSIDKNAFGVDELLARQDVYCSQLLDLDGSQFEKPLVIVSGRKTPKMVFRNMDVYIADVRSDSILSFVMEARKILRSEAVNVKSYVAGTPFQPFLAALLLHKFYARAPIHTAIHGEVSALRTGGSSNRLKFLFLKLFISKASTLRFVSKRQFVEACELLPISKTTTFVTPVPVLITKEISNRKKPQTIAFVGRLQSERGVHEWIEIARHFNESSLVVIGEGPLLLTAKLLIPQAKFFGYLENSKVQEIWSEIGVLLSTAQFESYGLAMREALLHGVPVVSRRNAGSLELQAQYPKLVALYESPQEAVEKIHDVLAHTPSIDDFNQFREEFFSSQKISLQNLARAWSNEL